MNPEIAKLMDQGKIEEIIASKPNERRVVFEEAAGVLKYKRRKEESLRKLEKTHSNMQRVNDIISELEIQVEPLKEQKEKSERDSFNRDFETWGGKQTDSGVEFQIDKIIKNNKKNSDHLVEVLFDGTSYGTDPNNIKTIKNSLKTWTSDRKIQYYEISIDYDSNGYVNKVTIETR